MKVPNATALRHHIFSNEDYIQTPISSQRPLSPYYTLCEATNSKTTKKYLMLKAKSTFGTDDYKYLFIQHAERATELIHPVLLPLLGFSDKTPDLYFDYYPGIITPITDEQLQNLDNTSIEIIILGIISGLMYLLSKGFSVPDINLNAIFFSKENGPKFVDYVNYNALEMNYALNQYIESHDEKLLTYQIGQVICQLYSHRRRKDDKDDVKLPEGLDPTLTQCVNSCKNFNEQPSLTTLFESLSNLFKNDPAVEKYLTKLESADKFRYDYRMDKEDYVPFQILMDGDGNYVSNKYFDNDVNILHSCYIQNEVFSHKEYFPLLNRLPDSDIKLLLENQIGAPKEMYEFLCYEKEYLLLPPEYHNLFFSGRPENNFLIYQKLMEKSRTEKEPNQAIYPIALKHLKHAAKKNHIEAKIVLALHYLKGDIVPANCPKALMWLKYVAFGNQMNVSRYIDPINAKEKEIEKAIKSLSNDLKALIINSEKSSPLDLLYLAFAFHAGIDTFPVSPSRSIYYYREAAKKSPSCMCLLGGMYLQGYIFPRNLIRARNCFKKAALNGSFKAKILDALMRKHIWRYYLSDVSISDIYKTYLQCPESLSFDDTLIFPEINYLIANQQNLLLQTSPFMTSYFFYDQRNRNANVKKNEMKLAINSIDYKVPNVPENQYKNGDIKIMQFYSYLHIINQMLLHNILPQQLNPIFHETPKNVVVDFVSRFLEEKFGFIFADNEDEGDVTVENMIKCGISSDKESELSSLIQSKFIPVDTSDNEYQCSSVSYIPQISLPIEKVRMKELKEAIDDCLKEVLPEIINKDKDGYFIANYHEEDEATAEYFDKLQAILKTTIQDHMYDNQVCKSFVTEIDVFEVYHSEPIFYSATTANVKEDDVKTQLFIAESYFNGENGFPVNYTEAAKYYQMAADNGNAESQWKIGQLKVNGLGTKQDEKSAFLYMQKSADQKEPDGMLRFSLFIRHFLVNHKTKENVKWPSFRQYLEQSAQAGNIEAINQLGMFLESNYCYDEITKSIDQFDSAVEKGYLDSIFRMIHIYDNPDDKKKYRNIVKQSIGLCENDITMRMIDIYNHKKRYEQSNRLIKVGLCFDYDFFLPSHAKHVAFYSTVGNLRDRLNYAKSLLMPILKEPSQSILDRGFLEMYLMAMITILSKANEYDEACELLIENMNCLSLKSKQEYIDFYMHINKKVARKYQLSINSYLPEYRACVEAFQLINQKGIHIKAGNNKLKLILQDNSSNQFALLKRGKILLKNHLFMRRNIPKALELIQKAAKQNCPEARFEYGKELYYGRTLPMNRWKAFKYFSKAFDKTNQDPRAGYFLSKKCYISNNFVTQVEADKSLEVAARSGYRRALFKLGKKLFNDQGNKSLLGIILIKKARDQKYSKSIEFLDAYESRISSDDSFQENEAQAVFSFAKELYYGRIIAQDVNMSFTIFMKFFNNAEPDLKAGYYLSKKKFIQRELISPSQARNALVISAKSHYKRAQYRLGKLYYTREGKLEKGLNLIRKAKRQNYEKAIVFLEKIKNQELRRIQTEEESSIFIPRKLLSPNFPDEEEDEIENYITKNYNTFHDDTNIENEIDKENDASLKNIQNISANNDNNNNNNNNTTTTTNEQNTTNVTVNNNNDEKMDDNEKEIDMEMQIKDFKFDDEVIPGNNDLNASSQILTKSGRTSSNKFNILNKLKRSSSKLVKEQKELGEPLFKNYDQEIDSKSKEPPARVRRPKINLDDEVSSDFSDEPPDEDDQISSEMK
ncbi:hypothetical protein M9Y10_000208 [Tritrichomonas musculus]|uniref:Protein kinase domain-containing protein n=1 Tax=Tritrichomonas musculus TaxID=1915356 RepID=A0ABR2L3Q9_9EUKA